MLSHAYELLEWNVAVFSIYYAGSKKKKQINISHNGREFIISFQSVLLLGSRKTIADDASNEMKFSRIQEEKDDHNCERSFWRGRSEKTIDSAY